jgi:hypothetical protein
MHPIRQHKLGIVHISGPRAPLLTAEEEELVAGCCIGSAVYGADRCTCWEPVFEEEQAPARTDLEPQTREKWCIACAYRKGSPEEVEYDLKEDLRELDGTFWCHTGMRRPVAYRHPAGIERPASPLDYQPLEVDGVPYKADGTPADRCAGWNAFARRRATG